MSIFGKKEDDFDEEELERKVPSKSFRDLRPENRRRRKEPPKPWGKFERLLVLGVLGATIIASGILALTARGWKLPGFPKISLPSFSFDLFEGDTITIGKKLDPVELEQLERAKRAIASFNLEVDNLSGVYAFYVVELESGFSYGVSEAEIIQAASLIKLPVIAALYKEAEAGNFDLDAKYTLKTSDKVGGSGSLQSKPAGTVLTYRELVDLMGKQSDNTAFNIIKRELGDEKINETIRAIGMDGTSLEENETTPADIGIFFEKLWKGEIVSKESADSILDSLTDTIYEEHLVAGVPEDIRVAHKYGREVHVINDAGVVYADKPFVLVIMSEGVVEAEADEVFPELARLLYDEEVR